MIRISGGRFRGRQLYCAQGKSIRPTTSFVRESLFSILGPRIIDARVLDLFAGCGIVGIEALSRGAASVVALENVSAHCRLLEKNREHLSLNPSEYAILCQDAFRWAKNLPHPVPESQQFDVIFLDPPYALEGVNAVVVACFQHQLLSSHGTLVWESGHKVVPEVVGAQRIDTRTYGESALSFFRYPEG
jgi:16S rRNA (guanine966-N2)-methyltransferase